MCCFELDLLGGGASKKEPRCSFLCCVSPSQSLEIDFDPSFADEEEGLLSSTSVFIYIGISSALISLFSFSLPFE